MATTVAVDTVVVSQVENTPAAEPLTLKIDVLTQLPTPLTSPPLPMISLSSPLSHIYYVAVEAQE